MKHAKTAALIAGSVVALGASAATPASAAEAVPTSNTSLNGGIAQALSDADGPLDQATGKVLGGAKKVTNGAKKVTSGAKKVTRSLPLVGGLPLGG